MSLYFGRRSAAFGFGLVSASSHGFLPGMRGGVCVLCLFNLRIVFAFWVSCHHIYTLVALVLPIGFGILLKQVGSWHALLIGLRRDMVFFLLTGIGTSLLLLGDCLPCVLRGQTFQKHGRHRQQHNQNKNRTQRKGKLAEKNNGSFCEHVYAVVRESTCSSI